MCIDRREICRGVNEFGVITVEVTVILVFHMHTLVVLILYIFLFDSKLKAYLHEACGPRRGSATADFQQDVVSFKTCQIFIVKGRVQ